MPRRRDTAVLVAALLCAVLAALEAPPARAGEPPDVVEALERTLVRVKEKVAPAVVTISAVGGGRTATGNIYEDPFELYKRRFFGERAAPEQRRNVGSGVIIDPAGYVLTNHHVVADTEQIFITLSDGRTLKGTLLGSDPQVDLAVIKVKAPGPLHALSWVKADQVRSGQFAVAFGNPWGLARDPQPTVTLGIVSAVNRSLTVGESGREFTGLIQTDAAINPGNSGGPLVDIRGRMLGINTAIFSTTGGYQGIGFAVPFSERVEKIVAELKKGREVGHPWLGLSVSRLDPVRARLMGLGRARGLVVERVVPDGPAANAGLRAGDLITGIGEVAVTDPDAVRKLLTHAAPGDRWKLQVLRKGERIEKTLVVGDRRTGLVGAASPRFWRGMSVRPVPPGKGPGVLVDEVAPDSPAWKADLRPGDVVRKVNEIEITSPAEFRDAVAGAEGQDVLLQTARGLKAVQGRN
jgi:S1-C subfamily serine protease